MALTVADLHGILLAACRKAAADGVPLLDILAGMSDGAYSVALSGSGVLDIVSTSNAGQSVTLGSSAGAPSQVDSGRAGTLLYRLGVSCPAINPPPADANAQLCACIQAKLPIRGIRSVRSSYLGMTADV